MRIVGLVVRVCAGLVELCPMEKGGGEVMESGVEIGREHTERCPMWAAHGNLSWILLREESHHWGRVSPFMIRDELRMSKYSDFQL